MECSHCGYEITTYTEAVESLESGCRCLLCGGELPRAALEEAIDGWSDEALFAEGGRRAEDEAELAPDLEQEEADPDFGDEGEEEDDPVL
ncbi:MAG: hypothetical protein D6702_00625 [Planctomycetota bacterium]|nr:MAG: hypothetical protein D6702_00625 [Planctomycetota bacterium]